jgi:fatty-acyl-CoA synthase
MQELQASELTSLDDILEFERIPVQQRYPACNIYQLLSRACRSFNSSPAMSFLPTGQADEPALEISYLELLQQITQTANLLHELGIRQHDTVSILLPTLPETHLSIWGGAVAGISSPVNPLLDVPQIVEILNATRSKVLIAPGKLTDSEIWEKIQTLAGDIPSLETIVVVNQHGPTDSSISIEGINEVDFWEGTQRQKSSDLDSKLEASPDDIAMYMHTGGTTGCPKIARLSHGNLTLIARLYAEMSNRWGQVASFAGLPLFHVFGIIGAGLSAFVAGRHVVLLSRTGFRNPVVLINLWRLVERFQVPVFAAVPTTLARLSTISADDCDISCLKQIATGAAPLSTRLQQDFEQRFNVKIMCGYGMTECTMILTRCSPSRQPPEGSVGLRIPYVRLKIAKVRNNLLSRECAPNETGVVLVQGPNLFQGYLKPGDVSEELVNHYWFNTGDLGYLDEDGFLYLTGRAKDLIIRGGHNIDPAVIENVLTSHPSVSDAIAIGQPDTHAGEVPVAFVKLREGFSSSEEDLLEYARQHMTERAAVPKRIEVIDEIPLTAVAKVFKPTLRERAASRAVHDTLSRAGIDAEISARHDPDSGLTVMVMLPDPEQLGEAQSELRPYALHIEYTIEPGKQEKDEAGHD